VELTFGENDVERPEATDCIAEICCVTYKGDQRAEKWRWDQETILSISSVNGKEAYCRSVENAVCI